jgi:hypothetical protein
MVSLELALRYYFSTNCAQEQNNDVPGIETTVAKAKGLIVGNKRPVADLVDLLYAHAAIFLRRYRSVEPSRKLNALDRFS